MRTFVAVEINEKSVINSIKELQMEIKINAKPIPLNNLHFTLQFLGNISEQKVKEVKEELRSIRFSSFEVGFEGIGAFPKPEFPRVIWVGTDDNGSEKLTRLANSIEDALRSLGFKNDKPFSPHITIFRIKKKVENISQELKRFSERKFGIQIIEEIKFKKSTLTPNGPIYSDLFTVKSEK